MESLLKQSEILNSLQTSTVYSVLEKYNIKTLLTFGSINTSDFTEQSDIDLAVIAPSPLSLDNLLDLEIYFQKLFKREIDVIDLKSSNLDLFVKINILNTGRIIFSNDSNLLFNNICDETDRLYRENENFMYFRKVDLLS